VERVFSSCTVRRVPEGKMFMCGPVRKGSVLVSFVSGETAGCAPSLAEV